MSSPLALQLLVAALAGGALGGLAVWVLAGRGRPPILTTAGHTIVMANQFILQDGAGRPRATLTTGEGGAVGLFLFNADGTKPAAQFTVPEGGFANLAFYDSSGKIEWLARTGRNPTPEDSLALSKILPRWN